MMRQDALIVVFFVTVLVGFVNANATVDGLICANAPKKAWLDIAVIVQTSTPTTNTQVMLGIINDVTSCLYQLNIGSNGDQSSRIALVTYDGKSATLQHGLNTNQTFDLVRKSLRNLINIKSNDTFANMAAGLKLAYNHLNTYASYRFQAYVIVAATYDTNGFDYPGNILKDIKNSGAKVATLTYAPVNGVFNPNIGKLASPGLTLTNHKTPQNFAQIISIMNCQCPAGQTQLELNGTIYAECFSAAKSVALSTYTTCPNRGKLISMQTHNRFVYITKDLLPQILPNSTVFNVGLVRSGAYNHWNWDSYTEMLPYQNYPIFNELPTKEDSWGYLAQNRYGTWELNADDGNSSARPYICASRACDASYKC